MVDWFLTVLNPCGIGTGLLTLPALLSSWGPMKTSRQVGIHPGVLALRGRGGYSLREGVSALAHHDN